MKHGIGLNKILGTIHIYPTLAEANKYAAGVWKKRTRRKKAAALGRAISRVAADDSPRRRFRLCRSARAY